MKMYIIYGYIDLYMPFNTSLKEKRKIIHSIINRIRSRFNISVAEVANHDIWQRSTIAYSAVASSPYDIDLIKDCITSTLDLHIDSTQITGNHFEIVHLPISN